MPTITPETLLGPNLRCLRIVSGQHVLALKIDGGFTNPLILDVNPVYEEIDTDDVDEDGNVRKMSVVKSYQIRMLPLYMIPGTIVDMPEIAIKPEHVMCEAIPSPQMVEGYFKTNAAYAAAKKDVEQ